MTDILITQTFVEALTQNASADVRVTGMQVEVLQQSTGAELRLTGMYVEVLQEYDAGITPKKWLWMGDGLGGKIWIE